MGSKTFKCETNLSTKNMRSAVDSLYAGGVD